MKSLIPLCLLAAIAHGQVQRGRVTTDYAGAVAIFETAASLAGEAAAPVERIMESVPGGVAVTATSPLEPRLGGVMGPRTNDNGDLRAYSFHQMRYNGRNWSTEYTGVVRHMTDGWEVRRPGRVNLSRDGRWAAWANNGPGPVPPTLEVDLWTGAEFPMQGGALSVADDGSLASISARSLVIHRPGEEPRSFALPFNPSNPMLDRYATYASVYGADGLWRVNLATGEAEPWVPQCNNCEVLDIGANGSAILYSQWSILHLAAEPGSPPRRLTREGQSADAATFNGRGDRVIASTPEGILNYDLRSGSEVTWVYGPTSFTREPNVLAPGLWVRQEGRGLVAAELRLNGTGLQPLRRSSSDLVWVVPPGERLGSLTVEIGQAQSPFAPATKTLEVQLAAPTFILPVDAGIVSPARSDYWAIIRHADTGKPVDWPDAARPGESITVIMTGLNGQGASVEWLVNTLNVDNFANAVFESAEPAPDNPDWTVVRLKMPGALPTGLCALSVIYGNSRAAALLYTTVANQP